MLSEQELLHYSRQIILPEIDEVGQTRLKRSSVLIVGLGGLGSPVALYLAAAGVGNLTLADGDCVESSNLQRQIIHQLDSVGTSKVDSAISRLKQLNPWCKFTGFKERLYDEKLSSAVGGVDLVIDASDNFETRFAINKACIEHSKPLISGSAMRFEGQLAVFNATKHAPCYACLYPASSNFEEESCEYMGILSPVVGVIGSLQATEAIKLLTGAGKVMTGQLLTWNALTADFTKFDISKDPKCNHCSIKTVV